MNKMNYTDQAQGISFKDSFRVGGGLDDKSVKEMADRLARNAKKTSGGDFTQYGALQPDGKFIICDVIGRTGEFIKVKLPDGREKMITAADGYIPVQMD